MCMVRQSNEQKVKKPYLNRIEEQAAAVENARLRRLKTGDNSLPVVRLDDRQHSLPRRRRPTTEDGRDAIH
jgi:hypothetical protein